MIRKSLIVIFISGLIFFSTFRVYSQDVKSSDFGLKILSPGIYFDYQVNDKLYLVSEIGLIAGYTYEFNDKDRKHNLYISQIKIEPRYSLNSLLFIGIQLKYAIPFDNWGESLGSYGTIGLRKEWKRIFIDAQTGFGMTYFESVFDPSFFVGIGIGIKLIELN